MPCKSIRTKPFVFETARQETAIERSVVCYKDFVRTDVELYYQHSSVPFFSFVYITISDMVDSRRFARYRNLRVYEKLPKTSLAVPVSELDDTIDLRVKPGRFRINYSPHR